MTDAVVVLARAPRPGRGKTRLRTVLQGVDAALVDAFVEAMVEDTLRWAAAGADTMVVAVDDGSAWLPTAQGARRVSQPCAPFGARLEHALGAAFDSGAARAVLVGTDSPTLPAHLLAAAFRALRRPDDAVLIPALDGGWVALGLGAPLGDTFAAAPIRWSTRHASSDTDEALRRSGRHVTRLSPWFDVDDADGLERLRADVLSRQRAPRTAAALAALPPPSPAAALTT